MSLLLVVVVVCCWIEELQLILVALLHAVSKAIRITASYSIHIAVVVYVVCVVIIHFVGWIGSMYDRVDVRWICG